MSDKGVIKELGLEKYFWTILDSSQDAKSGSSSGNQSRKSQPQEDTVEKKRGQAIEQEIEAKPLTQEKNESVSKIKLLNKLTTPSQESKPFFGSPSLFNGGSPDNDFISKASLTASGRKSPFMNFTNPPADAGFIDFDPPALQTNQKNAKSNTSPIKDIFSNVEPVVKIKFTPAAEEDKFRKQRSNSLDEADFELISQILEEEAKKSGNDEGAHTVKSLPVERTRGSEENNKDLDENTRGGFMPTLQTASLKPIASKAENLARAKAMFADDDDEFGDQTFLPQDDKIAESPKLQTASFKNIPIKQEHLARIQNLFADDDDDDLGFIPRKNKNGFKENAKNKIEESPKLQTASFKNITIKQENLARFQNMFADDEDDGLSFPSTKNNNIVNENPKNKIEESPKLQTASFKNIPFKKENLARYQNMFADDDNDLGFGPAKSENLSNNNDFPMLQTASFKPISVNQESLARIQHMFVDDDTGGQNFPPQDNNSNVPVMQTASMKTLKVKQENMARFQNMFADDDDLGFVTSKNKNVASENVDSKITESPKLQTASFKNISIKQENLARFKNMFADVDDGLGFVPAKSENLSNNNNDDFPMLQTASFKPISVNQGNLARFQNMFADDDDDGLNFPPTKNNNIVNENPKNKIEESPKLQTASFKNIHIQPESLARFKNMFADADDDLGFVPAKSENLSNNNNDFPMLQTASFKPISVKQENLARFQNMLADDDAEESNFPPQDNNNTNDFPGLQTASFKPLNAKQENLANAKSMFADDEEDELTAILQKNKNRFKQNLTINNNGTLSRITNLFKEDTETSTGFKKQVVNNKLKDQLPDPSAQNADAFSRLASQRSFSFRNPIKENNDTEMEIEPRLTTASFKPIAIDEAKLKRIEDMFSDDEDTNMFPLGANSKFGRQNKMIVEDNSSFGLLAKEGNSKDGLSETTKYNLKAEDSKKTVAKKVLAVEKPKFDRVMKSLQPEDKEARSNDIDPEITYKPLPPLIKGDENNVVPRDSDFLESAFNQLNQSQSNSNFEVSLQTGKGKKLQFSDKNLEDAFKFLTADSQEEAPKKEPLPDPLEVEEQKNEKSREFKPAPSPPLSSRDMQPTKKVLKEDLRVHKGIKKIKLNTENLKIPDKVPDNRFLTKSSTEAKSVKKNQSFKFTKENNSSNGNSPQPAEKTKSLKRTYNDISKENKGIVFPKNPKIQVYNLVQESKARKLIKPPRKSYFSLENLNKNYSKISNEIRSISVYTALDRKFICPCTESFSSQADFSNPLTDDVCYCNGNLLIGWHEMMQELLKDGLEQNHLKETWIKNHYRNIVWKLASIERRLCNFHPSKHLTADNVKKELEYRYYVEYVEGKRSVLQKIIEKDEFSSSHLVLLVGEIIKKPVNKKISYLVELSDGWYSVYFEIKPEDNIKNDKKVVTNNQLFFLLVNSRKLCPGTKIHVVGMKMVSAAKQDAAKPEGDASPEDAPTKTIVELDYNSVSRASWDAKLGLARPRCFPKSLLSVRNHGGTIPMIDVFVIKKYKLLEKAGGNLKQFQEDEGSSKGKVFFKIRVGDAIVYHNPESPQRYQDVFCEIEISGLSDDAYGQIKENERIRFYNLKSISNPEKNQPYYDNEKKKHFNHCLYLEFQRTSKYQTTSSMGGTFRQDANKFKEFAKENYKSYYFLTSLELTSNLFNFYQKDIRFCRNEIDMIGLVIETTPSKIFGCIGNGHFFQIALHSKPFFSNIKILDKKNIIINFRALQIHTVERLSLNDPCCCFFLRTNDYSSFGNLPTSLQSEAENLNSILKDQTKMETYREKINMIMKKY